MAIEPVREDFDILTSQRDPLTGKSVYVHIHRTGQYISLKVYKNPPASYEAEPWDPWMCALWMEPYEGRIQVQLFDEESGGPGGSIHWKDPYMNGSYDESIVLVEDRETWEPTILPEE